MASMQNNQVSSLGHTNLIKTCIEKHFDNETYAKFQQVLDYIGRDVYPGLYCAYNDNLLPQLQSLPSYLPYMPPEYSLPQHISLKVKFYSFRFISNVGKIVIDKLHNSDIKAEDNFVILTKILLYHGLTSKSDTANFALVELDQLCGAHKITLQSLYNKYRPKFLRLIIKAILYKLISTHSSNNDSDTSTKVDYDPKSELNSNNLKTNNNQPSDGNGNINRADGDDTTLDGSISRTSSSSGLGSTKHNYVITYMTRALEVFNVGTITGDDVAQSLIISTNLLHKEKYNDAIRMFLEYLASFQKIDLCTLIRSHIQAIIVSLFLRQKHSNYDINASLGKLCSFCQKTPRELLATKFTFIKGRLLLHYSINPKCVTDAIYYLAKFEKEEHEQPFEDEFDEEKHFIDYLNPSMIGILLGVDAHFTATKKDLGSDESIKQIRSLYKLLNLLDQKQVKIIHVKLLSTLSLLVRLRPNRKNENLNRALRDLWAIFVNKLEEDLRITLLINLCVAMYDLIDDCPADIAEVYEMLICKSENKLEPILKSLFFIPNVEHMEKVYNRISPHVYRPKQINGVDKEITESDNLLKLIDCVLPLIALENQKSRCIALKELKRTLKANQKVVFKLISTNISEPLDIKLTKLIQMLISLSSSQDPECAVLIAECLGIIGAVNPIRLDHLIYGLIPEKKEPTITKLSNSSFIIDLIEKLKNSLFSDKRSESESANYALQVVVKLFSVFHTPSIKDGLSAEALRACILCQNTSYSGTKKGTVEMNSSIYEKFKLDSQYSYKEWLDKFSSNLISSIRDKKIQEMLHACSYLFKYNHKLAEHLLPHAMIHIMIHQPTEIQIIKREVMAILEEDVGVSTQDLNIVYTDDVRDSIQTLHFQCANMTFCSLDAIHKLDCDTRGRPPLIVMEASQLQPLREFMDSLPKIKLAILASKCRSHARALCYFEQHLSTCKNDIDKYASVLQRTYVSLDDIFEASGVEMVRKTPSTLIDDVATHEARGRYDRAFVCCQTSLNSDPNSVENELLVEDVLRCLVSQGEYDRLYEKSKRLINEYPQYKRIIMPHAIEATWKLGKWDELVNTFNNESNDTLLFEDASVSKGWLIASTLEHKKVKSDVVEEVRRRLMKPLSMAMIDRSAYFRGYQNLLVLHGIQDFLLAEQALYAEEVVESSDSSAIVAANRTKSLSALIDQNVNQWDQRNKYVLPNMTSLEPILELQRATLLAIGHNHSSNIDKVIKHVGLSWLESADAAREHRSFDRAFFCLTQARSCFGSKFEHLNLRDKVKYFIQHAKLEWEQGERTRAIRGLKIVLDRMKGSEVIQYVSNFKRKNLTADAFPEVNMIQATRSRSTIDAGDCEAVGELKLLLAQYCEEAAAGLPETLFYMYEECVYLGTYQEETYFRLARYYDRLLEYYMENPKLCGDSAEEKSHFDATQRFSQSLMSGDREDVYTKLMEHSIIAFGNSLKFGVKYLTESMPRLLNIWYDLGSRRQKALRSISSRIENTVRFVDQMRTDMPAYFFMPAISILLSRVCHPHSGVAKKTYEILDRLINTYPHQLSWLLIALLNDNENEDRKRAARGLLSSSKKRSSSIDKIVHDTVEFSKYIIELCHSHTPLDRTRPESKKKKLSGYVALRELSANLAKLDFTRVSLLVPDQNSIRAVLPHETVRDHQSYSVFPRQNLSFVKSIESKARIFNSLQQPRQIVIHCDNGKTVNLLCKSGDDLRKDSRCVEFLNLLNRILRRNKLSNARFFEIQTFLVLPLECQAGIIEMVPNCDTLRNIIDPLYKERKPTFSIHEQIPKRVKEYTANEQHELFKTVVLQKVTPPVLPTWFLRRFIEPTSWYMARLAFTRSAAVISMGGYIIGLGDRHLDNILVDTCNGRVVHVDFNLLFHQGESLPTPERVPFRLTQNLIAAFGSMGTEGNFRKVCEIAMRVMRQEKDALLTTLKPFMHDPCSEWIKSRDGREKTISRNEVEDKHAENKSAKFRIEVTERKLKGFPRSKKFKPLTLIDSYSVEAQVDNLIEEAADTFNLAQMYYGWCPHI